MLASKNVNSFVSCFCRISSTKVYLEAQRRSGQDQAALSSIKWSVTGYPVRIIDTWSHQDWTRKQRRHQGRRLRSGHWWSLPLLSRSCRNVQLQAPLCEDPRGGGEDGLSDLRLPFRRNEFSSDVVRKVNDKGIFLMVSLVSVVMSSFFCTL